MNSKYMIKTKDGFKDFEGIVKSPLTDGFEIIFSDGFSIKVSRNHRFIIENKEIIANSLKIGNFLNKRKIIDIKNIKDEFFDPLMVEGSEYLVDNINNHNCNIIIVDEAAFINPNVFEEFVSSVLPSQSSLAYKQNLFISTANGRNHFYDIWRESGNDQESSKNGFIKYFVDWRDTPRFNKDGNRIDPEEFKRNIIKKHGSVYWSSNYENDFIGSSSTLIPGEILAKYVEKEPEFHYQPGLNVYESPIKGHKYIMGVDSAKDGRDYFAVQILDITNFRFKQVASAHLQIDYLSMPEILDEWGKLFNNAFIIIENNEGAGQSVADTLFKSYEYENMYFDLINDKKDKKRKKYPGFRTTRTSRDLILQTLKTLAVEGNLELVDKKTIDELFDFKLINKKYQADEGKHDDLVMALCMCFAIFNNTKNFEDMKEVIKGIKSNDSDIENLDDLLVIGSFDSGLDNEFKEDYTGGIKIPFSYY